MRKETNALGETLDLLRRVWIDRKGNETPAAVFHTIDALWPKEPKPIFKSKKTESGYIFLVHLPPGISYSDFKKHEQYFADSTGGAVVIEKNGKVVVMKVLTEDLKPQYAYSWDFKPYEKMALPVPFGYSAAGLIVRDLADAPNLIVAGHPGAGKSNFLHQVAVSLLLARRLYLVIVDLKRLEFSYLKNHSLLVTELDGARMLLRRLNSELDKRLAMLEKAGVVKIQDYPGEMPWIVLMIDELAELQDEQCQTDLNRIVRLGRAAGFCDVCATQRPSSTIFQKFGDSKAMFSATMCFHVRDEINSRMVLDNPRAALIPNIPGRAIYQWEQELEVQTMFLPVKQAKQLLTGTEGGIQFDGKPCKRLPPR